MLWYRFRLAGASHYLQTSAYRESGTISLPVGMNASSVLVLVASMMRSMSSSGNLLAKHTGLGLADAWEVDLEDIVEILSSGREERKSSTTILVQSGALQLFQLLIYLDFTRWIWKLSKTRPIIDYPARTQ
jgi:hypothetical protein